VEVCIKRDENFLHTAVISSITFFNVSGDLSFCLSHAKMRISKILDANPWLLCWLARHSNEHNNQIQMVFPASPRDKDIEKLVKTYDKDGPLEVHADMPYDDLKKSVSRLHLKTAAECINKTGEEFRRASFVLVPTKKAEGFALVFELCHVVGDGHTYYTILNMVSKDVPIVPLQIQRAEDSDHKLEHMLGSPEARAFCKRCLIFEILKKKLCRRSLQVTSIHNIDMAEVALKKKAVPAGTFISTNDILCTHLFQHMGSDIAIMLVNLRNRIPEFADTMAGNFEGGLCFDREGYADAQSIRASTAQAGGVLHGGMRKSVPPWYGCMSAKTALITNWSSFARDLIIDGCVQQLHLPLMDLPIHGCIIFRACANKLCVLYQRDAHEGNELPFKIIPHGKRDV